MMVIVQGIIGNVIGKRAYLKKKYNRSTGHIIFYPQVNFIGFFFQVNLFFDVSLFSYQISFYTDIVQE